VLTRLDRLVTDVLLLSDLGEQAIRRGPVDLQVIAARVVEEVCARDDLPTDAVTVDPLPEVVGDPTLLAVVLERLVDNAVTFTVPGRHPGVRLTADLTGQGWRGEQWRVEVGDRGTGVPADALPTFSSPSGAPGPTTVRAII
jgi:signal transduction histidine kinase